MSLKLFEHRHVSFGELVRASKMVDTRKAEDMPGIFPIDSHKGQILMFVADDLQRHAENSISSGDLISAENFYTEALLRAIQVRSNCIQQTLILHGRSQVYCEMKDYEKALQDADLALKYGHGYTEALLQVTTVLKHVKEYEHAFICVISKLKSGEKIPSRIRAAYVKLAVELSIHLKDGYDVIKSLQETQDIWDSVGHQLAVANSWDLLKVLLLGNSSHSPILVSINAVDINLSYLVFNKTVSWNDWGEKLAIVLLKNGAKHNTICPQQQHPFQAALKISLKTGTTELFDYLCKKYPSDVQNWRHKDGSTLLHIACSYASSSCLSKCIGILFEHNVDPCVSNTSGKQAHQILSQPSKESKLIQDKIAALSPAKITPQNGNQESKTAENDWDSNRSTIDDNYEDAGVQIRSMDKSQPLCTIWSCNDVQRWLKDINLEAHSHRFDSIDGILLAELCRIQRVAPERFFNLLENKLHLPYPALLQLSGCLRSLY